MNRDQFLALVRRYVSQDAERLSAVRLSAKGWSQRAIAERLKRSQSAIGAAIRQETSHV